MLNVPGDHDQAVEDQPVPMFQWASVLILASVLLTSCGEAAPRAVSPVPGSMVPSRTVATASPPDRPPFPCGRRSFYSDEIEFKPDSAELVNEAESKAQLKAYADTLRLLGVGVVVSANTTYEEKGPTRPLANGRAHAAKQLLVANGVPERLVRTQVWSGHEDSEGDPFKKTAMIVMKPDCI